MWISLYTFLEMSLFVSATLYDKTQNFFTILTVWTKIVHTASGEDNHCPHCYGFGLYVKNVENVFYYQQEIFRRVRQQCSVISWRASAKCIRRAWASTSRTAFSYGRFYWAEKKRRDRRTPRRGRRGDRSSPRPNHLHPVNHNCRDNSNWRCGEERGKTKRGRFHNQRNRE